MSAQHQSRWALYGLVDGLVLGAATGFGLMAFGGVGLGALVGALFGGGVGTALGFLGGLAIDAARAGGASDALAVWAIMTPLTAMALWWSRAPLVVAVPAVAVVVADLLWRLARLRRRTSTR